MLLGACAVSTALAGTAHAETVNILMEGVPDTEYVKALVPEFEQETGIDVNIEVVNYAEMHTKLVPQLVCRQGSYSAIVVDFYWVGEFTKAGWLQPLDDRIAADKFDTSVYVPEADGSRRQGRRHHLHAALLQLRDGPDSIAPTSSRTRRTRPTSRRSTAWS